MIRKLQLTALGTLLGLASAAGAAQAQSLGLSLPLGKHAYIHLGYKHAPRNCLSYAPPQQYWVPGQWECIDQRVWVPGTCEQVWIAPVYRTCFDPCGRPYHVLGSRGYWKTIETPGHYEARRVQVWKDGRWEVDNGCG